MLGFSLLHEQPLLSFNRDCIWSFNLSVCIVGHPFSPPVALGPSWQPPDRSNYKETPILACWDLFGQPQTSCLVAALPERYTQRTTTQPTSFFLEGTVKAKRQPQILWRGLHCSCTGEGTLRDFAQSLQVEHHAHDVFPCWDVLGCCNCL